MSFSRSWIEVLYSRKRSPYLSIITHCRPLAAGRSESKIVDGNVESEKTEGNTRSTYVRPINTHSLRHGFNPASLHDRSTGGLFPFHFIPSNSRALYTPVTRRNVSEERTFPQEIELKAEFNGFHFCFVMRCKSGCLSYNIIEHTPSLLLIALHNDKTITLKWNCGELET